jgi:hypothetical protein
MTERQFYEELAKTDAEWSLTVLGMIRGGKSHQECRLSATCNRLRGTNFNIAQFYEAGNELGISRQRVRKIADAADNFRACDKNRRAKLLVACKLTEAI